MFVTLLVLQVLSIKCGMWDSMSDMSETMGTHELPKTVRSIKNASPVNTEHATEHGQSEYRCSFEITCHEHSSCCIVQY